MDFKRVYVAGKIESVGGQEGLKVLYSEPMDLTDVDIDFAEEVNSLFNSGENLKIYRGNSISPFFEIVNVSDDGIFVLKGLNYCKNIVSTIKLSAQEMKFVCEIPC